MLRDDPRLIVSDAERLVIRAQLPFGSRRKDARYIYGGIAILVGLLLALACWLFPFINPIGAGALWLMLVVGGAAFVFQEGVLVAQRADDSLFTEWRNILTRRKRRVSLGRLSSVTGYEVRRHLDSESGLVPYVYFELRLVGDGTRAVWYSESEEAAAAVGETILRLRPGGR